MNWYKKTKISDNIYDDIAKFGPREEGAIDETKLERHVHFGISEYKYNRREQFINEYGWSVPDREAIESIKEFVGNEPIIEIGAGYGLWAKLLQDAGVTVKATDLLQEPEEHHMYNPKARSFTDVEQMSHQDAMQAYGHYGVLMLAWPPYDESMAAETLKTFRGNKLVYVGEGSGGCTADDEFCSILTSNWQNVGRVNIPQWWGIHDDLSLWVRK